MIKTKIRLKALKVTEGNLLKYFNVKSTPSIIKPGIFIKIPTGLKKKEINKNINPSIKLKEAMKPNVKSGIQIKFAIMLKSGKLPK